MHVMEQPDAPVLHPPTAGIHPNQKIRTPPPVVVRAPSQVATKATTVSSGFPWWLVIVVLIMADGKGKR
jgi:hypothetical protein